MPIPPMLRGVIEMSDCNVEDEGLLAMFDELLIYRPFTGSLLWRPRGPHKFRGTIAKSPEAQSNIFNNKLAGKRAGSVAQQPFRVLGHMGAHFQCDRIAWALYYGAWPKGRVLHLNGDLADDRIENLVDEAGAEERRPGHGPVQRPAGPALPPVKLLSSAMGCRMWSSLNGRTCLPYDKRTEDCLPAGVAKDGHGRWLLPSRIGMAGEPQDGHRAGPDGHGELRMEMV